MDNHRDWYGKDVLDECNRLRKVLQPVSDTYHGPLFKAEASNTLFPFVLLLGNHSSGKSSFINYILNRKVQQTGVAPTDDCFTIICPGESDMDKNGPAFVGDPDLGFSGLKSFGPVLVNHTQLKVRTNIAVKDFMIIDSPGMIDSPVSRNTVDVVLGDNDEILDRGYDFAGVCRWYAERADVILLFFDPDKPGTTGETLSILTKSLKGYDHKLHIILNKADQFRKIHDFARAYGSLCWNLSKVIPRKDLPRIHTMCLPTQALPSSKSPSPMLTSDENATADNMRSSTPLPSSTNAATTNTINEDLIAIGQEHLPSSQDRFVDIQTPTRSTFFDQGFLDLEEARTEVIREAFNAPKRRVDNEISRLYEDVSSLDMHCKVIQEVVQRYSHHLWSARLWSVGTAVLSVAATIGVQYLCDYVAQRNITWSVSGVALLFQSMIGSSSASSSLRMIKTDANDSATSVSAASANGSAPTAAAAASNNMKTVGKSPETSSNAGRTLKSASSNTTKSSSNSTPTTNDVRSTTQQLPQQPLEEEATSVNPDTIYQKIILCTGATGVVTTCLVTAWKYIQLHRHLQQYAATSAQEQAKRRQHWSLFGTVPSSTVASSNTSATIEDSNAQYHASHERGSNNRVVFENILMDMHVREYKKDVRFTPSLVHHVLDHLCDHLTPAIIPNLSSVPEKQFIALNRIATEDIANLRRRATPSFPALSPAPKVVSAMAHAQAHALQSQSQIQALLRPSTSMGAWTPDDSSVHDDEKEEEEDVSRDNEQQLSSPVKSAFKEDLHQRQASVETDSESPSNIVENLIFAEVEEANSSVVGRD